MHNMDSRVEPPSPSLGALRTTTPFASACALNAALFFSGAGGRATLLRSSSRRSGSRSAPRRRARRSRGWRSRASSRLDPARRWPIASSP